MNKKGPFIFVVEGSGYFPFDMLRYDQCWPRHEVDSGLIETFQRVKAKRQITLMSNTHAPTVARWASFGWKVLP